MVRHIYFPSIRAGLPKVWFMILPVGYGIYELHNWGSILGLYDMVHGSCACTWNRGQLRFVIVAWTDQCSLNAISHFLWNILAYIQILGFDGTPTGCSCDIGVCNFWSVSRGTLFFLQITHRSLSLCFLIILFLVFLKFYPILIGIMSTMLLAVVIINSRGFLTLDSGISC